MVLTKRSGGIKLEMTKCKNQNQKCQKPEYTENTSSLIIMTETDAVEKTELLGVKL